MYERSHRDGPDDLFDERYLRLGITFRGAGRAEGDLTPQCAAALDAVLETLGKKAGPEDTRTAAQRRHDALEEACTRLIASGMLPDGRRLTGRTCTSRWPSCATLPVPPRQRLPGPRPGQPSPAG